MNCAFTSSTYAAVSPAFNVTSGRWEVADPRVARMLCLFATEAEAIRFRDISLRQLADREKGEAAQAAAIAKAASDRAAYLASFSGWLDSDPMRAGRQLQTMEKQFVFRGKVATRKQMVETLVSEGRQLTDNGLEGPNGYMAIGKTERSYAAHLIAARLAAVS